jgi:hypothetical protein
MYNLDHNGRFSVDSSGSGHFGRWSSNINIKEGIDLGFGTSLYADFNGIDSYVYVDDYPKLRLSLAQYFTITGRIYPVDLSATDGDDTMYRTILHKCDQTDITGAHSGIVNSPTAGWGYTLAVTPDGKMRFTFAREGIKSTVETLPNVIIPSDPPFAYDFTVTVNRVNVRTIPASQVLDPGNVLGAGDEEEPELTPPLIAPRMEISVDNNFYALYTTEHLPLVDDGKDRRLRIGVAFPYQQTHSRFHWFKWKGGIQQIRIYNGYILTFPQIEHLHENKITVTDMPLGSPAWAGSTYIIDPSVSMGYDIAGFDENGYDTQSEEMQAEGFPGMDPFGFDPTGYDTLHITEQGLLQDGGYDRRGFSPQGFHCIPFSQS